MVRGALDLLFGCNHEFGFPMTRKGGGLTYQVCVQCGAEFEYDWKTMRRVRQITSRETVKNRKKPVPVYVDRAAAA